MFGAVVKNCACAIFGDIIIATRTSVTAIGTIHFISSSPIAQGRVACIRRSCYLHSVSPPLRVITSSEPSPTTSFNADKAPADTVDVPR
jgi:hypothetical protein